MRLSIGVPTYNQGHLLRITLKSILSQQVVPFEIVVSNNHSSDETAEVLKEFRGAVVVVSPPVHLDMMAHWNFLVAHTTGDWVALLSSDDVAMPNYVQVLQQGMSRSARAVLVRAGYEIIDQSGSLVERRRILAVPRIARFPRNVLEQVRGPKVNFAAFAVKRDGWAAVGGFPQECHLFGDWGLWLKLGPIGDFVYEDDVISQYRVDCRPGRSLARLNAELEDEVWIYKVLMPGLYKTYGVPHPDAFEREFVRRLGDRIKHASRQIGQEKRSAFAEKIRPYATSQQLADMLDEFMEGKVWTAGSPTGKLRMLLRMVYGGIRHFLWR